MTMARLIAMLSLLVAPVLLTASAQECGKGKSEAGEAFVDLTGIARYPLDTKDCKAVVLFFITNDCPISNYYASEISAIVKDHAGKSVRFFAVHVDPDLTSAVASVHAKTYGLICPVLIDSKHSLVKGMGATITPEAAVRTADGKLAYLGRIDDCYAELGKRRAAPDQRELRQALAQILAGQAVTVSRTKAVGCPIPKLQK